MDYYRVPCGKSGTILDLPNGPSYVLAADSDAILKVDSTRVFVPTREARSSPVIAKDSWRPDLVPRARALMQTSFNLARETALRACLDAYQHQEKHDPAALVLYEGGEHIQEVVPDHEWVGTSTFGVAAFSCVPEDLVGTSPTEVVHRVLDASFLGTTFVQPDGG